MRILEGFAPWEAAEAEEQLSSEREARNPALHQPNDTLTVKRLMKENERLRAGIAKVITGIPEIWINDGRAHRCPHSQISSDRCIHCIDEYLIKLLEG